MLPTTSENPFRKAYWLGTTDPRPLALFRLLFGSVTLFDLLNRIADVPVFLSDQGFALPMHVPGLSSSWSLFRLVGSPTAVMIAYLAGCISVATVTVGYRTRLAQVAMYVFLASLAARNANFARLGPDRVIGAMSFWLLFADSGAIWSLDWISRRRSGGPVPAIGLRLLQWQFGLILLCAGLSKLQSWNSGLALYRYFQMREIATPLSVALLGWPGLCFALTRLVPLLELTVPALLIPLAPLSPSRVRAAGLLACSALFLGILGCLQIGDFPELMLSGQALFVLPAWFDRLGWLGRLAPAMPTAAAAPAHRWQPVVATLGLAQLTLVIWSVIVPSGHTGPEGPVAEELRLTNLAQEWVMFMNITGLTNAWWSDLGTLSDGTRQEVLAGSLPRLVVGFAPKRHWSHLRYALSRAPGLRRSIVDYACREFNRTSPIPLASIELDLHERPITDPGEPPAAETVRPFYEGCP